MYELPKEFDKMRTTPTPHPRFENPHYGGPTAPLITRSLEYLVRPPHSVPRKGDYLVFKVQVNGECLGQEDNRIRK